MSASPSTYRTALALNNMAVTLMKKHCFELALKTINDSILLMKSAFHSEAMGTHPNDTFAAAYRRCSHALTMPDRGYMSGDVEVHVLDDEDYETLRSSVNYGPTSSIAFVVRISETLTCQSTGDSLDIAQQLGILVYNHGVASLLLSRHRSEGKSGKYLQKSSKSLRMADCTFSSILKNQEQDQQCPAIVLLLALTLNCLTIVLARQQLPFQAKEAQHAVSVLCSSVEDSCFTSTVMVQKSAPAA